MAQLSSEKGAGFERQICQRLSLWVSRMTRADVFWRSAMSGGRATLAAKRRRGRQFTAQTGDISAIHELGHALLDLFVVECKFYRDFEVHTIVFGKLGGEFCQIWAKLMGEARSTGRCPMLLAKQNRQPELLGTNKLGLAILRRGGCVEPTVVFPPLDLHLCLLRDVVSDVDFDKLRQPRG